MGNQVNPSWFHLYLAGRTEWGRSPIKELKRLESCPKEAVGGDRCYRCYRQMEASVHVNVKQQGMCNRAWHLIPCPQGPSRRAYSGPLETCSNWPLPHSTALHSLCSGPVLALIATGTQTGSCGNRIPLFSAFILFPCTMHRQKKVPVP